VSTRIYTNGWFSVPEALNNTSIYTQGWFEESDGPPSAPLGLTATAISYTDIQLTWVDVSTREDGYRVERSLAGQDDWSTIGDLPAGSTGFIDEDAVPDVAYDYRVIAYNTDGDSTPAVVTGVSAPLPPLVETGGPPVPAEEPRNTLSPTEVSFLSPNVYGLERDAAGSIVGNKF
jgi:hypothetical protein